MKASKERGRVVLNDEQTNWGHAVSAPALETNRCGLRPVSAADFSFLYALELHASTGFRWRFRGQTPSPEQFARSLFEGVQATFVVLNKSKNNVPIGVVTIYGADFIANHARFAAAGVPEVRSTGLMIEASAAAIDYAFTTWPFRKLYVETISFNLQQFASIARRWFEVEACLREYEYYDGRYWDKYFLSLSRESWQDVRKLALSEPGVDLSRFECVESPEQFCATLADALGIEPGLLTPGTSFYDDIVLDSLEWFALLVIIEDMAGTRLPEGLFDQLRTVEDAFVWVCQRQGDSALTTR